MKNNKGFGLILIILTFFLFASQASAQYGLTTLSPRATCEFYRNNPSGTTIIKDTENICTVRVGDKNSGFGYINGYYSGNKFCLDKSGAFWNSAGIPDSSNCYPISQTSATEQQNTSPKIITPPSFRVKELQYDTLPTGKKIQVGDDERIEITMPDGSLIQLDANATFTPISDYEVQSVFGRYRYMWQPFHDGKCIVGQNLVRQNCRKVTTRDAILGVTGTEFLVDTDEAGTTVTVLEGSLSVADLNVKKTIEVAGGQFTYIKHGGLPSDPKPFDSTKIDRWWEKKTLEQNSMIYALMIFGLIILIVIPIQIKRRVSAKKRLAPKVEKK